VSDTLFDSDSEPIGIGDLNGRWLATEAKLGGVKVPEDVLEHLTVHLSRGAFAFGCDAGIIMVHGQHRPPWLDVIATHGPNLGRFVPAIFAFAGGTLRICFDLSGTERPRDFRAPIGSRRFLVSYRRAERTCA
jgi:uncharacterized protein (TIGR03067 family)